MSNELLGALCRRCEHLPCVRIHPVAVAPIELPGAQVGVEHSDVKLLEFCQSNLLLDTLPQSMAASPTPKIRQDVDRIELTDECGIFVLVAGRPAGGRRSRLFVDPIGKRALCAQLRRALCANLLHVRNREPIQKLIRHQAAIASLPSGHVDMGDRPDIRLRVLVDSH